jgi:hypothetical protein
LASTFHEVEILPVVVEELGHGILCTHLHLLLQPVDVCIHVGGFLVFLRIAGYAVREGGVGDFHFGAVHKNAFIEVVDLLL